MSDEMKSKEYFRKYYTAFVFFAQESLTRENVQLHCTHKYLGGLREEQLWTVRNICDEFFKVGRVFPLAAFNERVDFYPRQYSDQGKISVLKSFIHKDAFFPELRKALDWFREDDYPEYIPHITTPKYPSVNGMFQGYAIMSGDDIIKYWRNPQWEAREKKAKQEEERRAKRGPNNQDLKKLAKSRWMD